MDSPKSNFRSRLRELAAQVSFAGILLSVLGGGLIFLGRDLPAMLGYDMRQRISGLEVLAILGLGVLAVLALVYASVLIWLVVGRVLFTRAEVTKVAFAGVTTRFDRWLVDRWYPKCPD